MASRLAHVLIFAAEPARLARFYAAVLGWPSTELGDGVTIVGTPPAAGIALHQVPPHILEPAPPGPPVWREDTALKPCFEVDDLEATGAAVTTHGGARKPTWSWSGRDYVECADPEGNVFQISAARR